MMDADDLELFDRSIAHATDSSSGAALDAALAELGWADALGVDRRAAVSLLFGHQGRANVTSSAIDRVLLDPDGTGERPDTAVVLPAVGGVAPPGTVDDDDGLHIRGLGTAASAGASSVIVVAPQLGRDVVLTVATADLTIRPVEGIDPWLGLVEITGTALPVDPSDAALRWPSMVARGQRAISHELIGASREMLALARTHALEREQFGQPIGMFQAVRHKLAETLVAIEAADAIVGAAWDDGTTTTAAMAKSMSGRAARTAAKHCQQVLAGIGFTTEHPLHRYIKRILVLDEMFGSARMLTKELGTDLVDSRVLPTQLPL